MLPKNCAMRGPPVLLSTYHDGYYDQPWLPKGQGTDNYEEKLQQTHKSL